MGRWSAWRNLLGVLWDRAYVAAAWEAISAKWLLTHWPAPEPEDKLLLGWTAVGAILILVSTVGLYVSNL
jgi:hypothetical protein